MIKKLSEPMIEILVDFYQAKGDRHPNTGGNRWRTFKSLLDNQYFITNIDSNGRYSYTLSSIGREAARAEIQQRIEDRARRNATQETWFTAPAIMKRAAREIRRLKELSIGGLDGLTALEDLIDVILSEKRLVDGIRLAQWAAERNASDEPKIEDDQPNNTGETQIALPYFESEPE